VTPLEFAYYSISHSLLAVLGWALLVAVVYQFLRRYTRGTFVLGLAVVSHWMLDAIVHRPDIPYTPAVCILSVSACGFIPLGHFCGRTPDFWGYWIDRHRFVVER
jgi:membrane-bound metal-dependent hydrolase YbcI (DUF457 family)